MREVHEGICGNHSESRSLVHKLIQEGYYWLTMQKDAQAYVKPISNIIRMPTEELTPMTALWPFAQWGLDIMGPFQTVARQLKFLVTQLEGAIGIWPNELISGLWAYKTMTKTPIRETPFRLAYGGEAVILVEVGLTSYKVEKDDEGRNDEAMRLQLDLVDDVRATTEQRLAPYQDLMTKHYNSRVRHRDFQV
ncbi:uncharacterized protein LOC142628822 [Castanea sativa]|uniref:uncharacterized protein LOC142628822 n=1 Tax=Castanea sativa TaxID=21020 RepID=UPI003F653FDF